MDNSGCNYVGARVMIALSHLSISLALHILVSKKLFGRLLKQDKNEAVNINEN